MPSYRTPRSLHRYSDGPQVGRLIARKLGRVTTPWQQYVLDVGMERVDGPGSPFAYSAVDVFVGRRCGKTVTSMGVPLARALGGPITLWNDRKLPFAGTHMAQNLVKAKQRFQKDLVEPYQATMSPSVWRAGVHLRASLGDTELRIDPRVSGKDWRWPSSSTLTVSAPTISSVRGDGLFHLTLDEILVFSAIQGEQLMSAASPTMAELGGLAQMWRVSNISLLCGPLSWMWDLRDTGRALTEAGDINSGRAYFEFTIPDDADPNDEGVWWDHYPALSDGLVRPEELRSDLTSGRMSVEAFAAEYLGRWPGALVVTSWQAIARADFDATRTELELPADAKAAIGVDIDPYGRSSSIVSAVDHPTKAETVLAEVLRHGPGSAWVADAVRQLAPTVAAIGIDDYGPGHDLIYALQDDQKVAAKIVDTKSQDFTAACYVLDSRFREGSIKIRTSDFFEQLRIAAAAAQRTSGKAWQYERRVAVSQTPLVGTTLAAWALGRAPEPETFFVY